MLCWWFNLFYIVFIFFNVIDFVFWVVLNVILDFNTDTNCIFTNFSQIFSVPTRPNFLISSQSPLSSPILSSSL